MHLAWLVLSCCWLLDLAAAEGMTRCELVNSFLAPLTIGSLGLRVKRGPNDEFTVVQIEPNSPSVAVLHVGDTIFSLGGESTRDMSLQVFGTKLNVLRSKSGGLVSVGYHTEHCPADAGETVPVQDGPTSTSSSPSLEDDGDLDEQVLEEEEEEEEEDEEVMGHFRVVIENFRAPLGLRLSQEDGRLVVVAKVSSLEQWKHVEVGDVLDQVHGEEVTTNQRLKTLLHRFEGRKILGMRFSRRLSAKSAKEEKEEDGEDGPRIAFELAVDTNAAQKALLFAQLEQTGNAQDGFIAVMESELDYIQMGDRVREIENKPVSTVLEAVQLLQARARERLAQTEISLVRGAAGTMRELSAILSSSAQPNTIVEQDPAVAVTGGVDPIPANVAAAVEGAEPQQVEQDTTLNESIVTMAGPTLAESVQEEEAQAIANQTTAAEEECQDAEEDEMAELQRIKEEAELKAREAELLKKQAELAQSILAKKLEAKEQERKREEEMRHKLFALKTTRARLEAELKQLEMEEEMAGLPSPVVAGKACSEQAIARALANPQLIQALAQQIAQALQG